MAAISLAVSISLGLIYFLFFHDQPRVAIRLACVAFIATAVAWLVADALMRPERLRAEEALRTSEKQFTNAFEYAPIGMALVATDGRWLKVNRVLCQILGYSSHELISRTFQEFTHPDDLAGNLSHFHQMLAGEIQTYQTEKRYVHKSGQPITVLLNVSLVRDRQNGPLHFVAQIQDISERKQAEEQLKSSNEQLRALAARLQRAREDERKRMAREIHDELGHRLTGLKMDLALLHNKVRQLAQTDPTVALKFASLFALMDDTVHLVRKLATELRPGILDELGLVAALGWQAQEFQSRTGTICACQLPSEDLTLGEETSTAMFRIFQELLTNVARHARASKVDVRLETNHEKMTLTVQDNGRGIRAEEISSTRSLGLVGLRERVDMISGELTIQGEPGHGTTITVKVPMKESGTLS